MKTIEAENLLISKGIHMEDFISYATYAAVVVTVQRLLNDNKELQEKLDQMDDDCKEHLNKIL